MRSDITEIMKEVDGKIDYDLNEKDIEGVLPYMRLHDSKHASSERAVRFLVERKKTLRKHALDNKIENDGAWMSRK